MSTEVNANTGTDEDAGDMIELHVVVENRIGADRLDEEDAEVPGTYAVKVPGHFAAGIQAGIALDLFHDKIAINCLDDFDITVISPSTKIELVQPDDYDSANVEDWDGEFVGRV